MKPEERFFECIAIVGKPRHEIALETHLAVYNWLKDRHYRVLVEKSIAQQLNLPEARSLEEIGQQAVKSGCLTVLGLNG